MIAFSVESLARGSDAKLKKLEELFRPPFDIMFEGTFKSVGFEVRCKLVDD